MLLAQGHTGLGVGLSGLILKPTGLARRCAASPQHTSQEAAPFKPQPVTFWQ